MFLERKDRVAAEVAYLNHSPKSDGKIKTTSTFEDSYFQMHDVNFPNAGLFFSLFFKIIVIIITDVLLSCPSEGPLLLCQLQQLSEPCPHHCCSPCRTARPQSPGRRRQRWKPAPGTKRKGKVVSDAFCWSAWGTGDTWASAPEKKKASLSEVSWGKHWLPGAGGTHRDTGSETTVPTSGSFRSPHPNEGSVPPDEHKHLPLRFPCYSWLPPILCHHEEAARGLKQLQPKPRLL